MIWLVQHHLGKVNYPCLKFLFTILTLFHKRYIKAPKDPVNNDDKEQKAIERKHKVEENAFGTYASKGGEKFVYRVKKEGAFGGYKIVTESTQSTMSREELLDMRKKKKSDRCNSFYVTDAFKNLFDDIL